MPDGFSDAHPVRGERFPDNLDLLKTKAKGNMVEALNEVFDNATTLSAQTIHCIAVAIPTNPATPADVPALPGGSHVIGYQINIGVAFAASSHVYIGDHSGSSGAAAPSSISGTTNVATTPGTTEAPVYMIPQGDLIVTNNGGDSATGSGFVLIKYLTQ